MYLCFVFKTCSQFKLIEKGIHSGKEIRHLKQAGPYKTIH